MNDFDYDVMQKAIIARGAAHKNRRKKQCTTASDYMTTKEKKQLNGEVRYYKMNNPMQWKEFVKMPVDLQINYITEIRKRYNVSWDLIAMSKDVSTPTWRRHLKKIGYVPEGRGGGDTKGKEEFLKWWNGVEEPIQKQVEIQEEKKIDTKISGWLQSVDITVVGNVDGVTNILKSFIGTDGIWKFTIKIEDEDNGSDE